MSVTEQTDFPTGAEVSARSALHIDEHPGVILRDGSLYPHSYDLGDLARLEAFIGGRHTATMREIAAATFLNPDIVVVRHDVDHDVDHALRFAKWEAERGIRSTYFLLQSSPYWPCPHEARELAALDHEVGYHQNAYATTEDPVVAGSIVAADLRIMRSWGVDVVGCADHGGDGKRPSGDLWNVYTPRDLGLEYEAYQQHRRGCDYHSDNRGQEMPLQWDGIRQAHLLIHPEHWRLP